MGGSVDSGDGEVVDVGWGSRIVDGVVFIIANQRGIIVY